VGSYPRADGSITDERAGTGDVAFTDAAAWVAALRRGD
jgi:hypothetical protein